MSPTRRAVLESVPGVVMLQGGLIDEDGDGKYLDDVLGLDKDRVGDSIPTFIAEDAEDAERIDPALDKYPIRVVVLSGRLQGTHIVTEEDL